MVLIPSDGFRSETFDLPPGGPAGRLGVYIYMVHPAYSDTYNTRKATGATQSDIFSNQLMPWVTYGRSSGVPHDFYNRY